MNRMTHWLTGIMFACCFAGGLAQTASAQTTWKFKGLEFPARDGWCTKETDQGTPSEPAPTLEARQCGSDFPYMSVGLVQSGDGKGPADTDSLVPNGVSFASGADGHKLVLDLILKKHTGCVETKYTVTSNAIPVVKGFLVDSEYKCADNASPVTFRNWTSFASTKKGDLWVVAFDYPETSVTGSDIAMLQSAIATIQAH